MPQWTIGASLLEVPLITVGGGERTASSTRPNGGSDSKGGNGSSGGSGSSGHNGGGGSNGVAYRRGEGSRARMLASGAQSSDACAEATDETADMEAAEEVLGGVQLQEISPVPPQQTSAANGASTDAAAAGDAAVGSIDRRGCCGGPCWRAVRATAGRVASPPIYGICAGLLIALLPPLHALLVGGCGQEGGGGSAPFQFLLQVEHAITVVEHTMIVVAHTTAVPCYTHPHGPTLPAGGAPAR